MEIGSKLHVVAAYAPWLNGLLEGSNRIVLNALKHLCVPGLGEDDYKQMAVKDILNNWTEHLNTVIQNLNNHILLTLKYLPNELLLSLIINSCGAKDPDSIQAPTEEEISSHMALVEQQRLDGYSSIIDHAARRKDIFDKKVRKHTPRIIVFQPGDLVQVHASEWVHTLASIKKLIPMWSIPHHVMTRQLNSYTLETLGGLPLVGVFNSTRL